MHSSEELPAVATPGTMVGGKYRVESVLGHGGMGIVLAATQVALGRRVALKVLTNAAFRGASERFAREAQIAAQISSPHVAQVLDLGEHERMPFLVMELLEGVDLEHERRARIRLPSIEAVDLVLQACNGLAHAHALQLVHRDIKPANIFLARARGGRRVVKILDFGITKEAAPSADRGLTASTDVFGTPQYMAPEQIRSAKNVDARCDQHALALVLHEMIAGQPVFDAESMPQLIVEIATTEAVPLRRLAHDAPAGLEAALTRALAKKPHDRFADIAQFAAAIAPYGGERAREEAAEIASILGVHAAPAGPGGLEATVLAASSPFAGAGPTVSQSMGQGAGLAATAAGLPARTGMQTGSVATSTGMATATGMVAPRKASAAFGVMLAVGVTVGLVGGGVAFVVSRGDSSSPGGAPVAEPGPPPAVAARPPEVTPTEPAPDPAPPAASSAADPPATGAPLAASGAPSTSGSARAPAGARPPTAPKSPSARPPTAKPPTTTKAPPGVPPVKKPCTGLDCM